MQIRCNFPDISYLSETQKNNFQFLIGIGYLSLVLLNLDLFFFENAVDPDNLTWKPSDQDPFFYSACKYKLITGMLQVSWINVGEECSTLKYLTLKGPIATAADDILSKIFPNFRKK